MTHSYTELLLGCGSRRDRKFNVNGRTEWTNLTTLDINPDHNPDIVCDLEEIILPFEDDSFDEIHAYDVLEHTGKQGDWRFFFAQWSEFYRILKPEGVLCATTPDSESRWAWGDPGHTRNISQESLIYLNQPVYTAEVGKTAITDYRFIYKSDFDIIHSVIEPDKTFHFAVQAVKPSRYIPNEYCRPLAKPAV